MNFPISERYQKVLVTVAMGFRTEADIQKNGLHRFSKEEKEKLLKHINFLFKKNNSVLALKVKQKGYRSEHILIDSKKALNNFIRNISDIYENDNEIWIVESSVLKCWRSRIYISKIKSDNMVEMAYSYNDHILDSIDMTSDVPYVCYKIENKNTKVFHTNLKSQTLIKTNDIVKDILNKYLDKFETIKSDLDFIGIDGISLDVRINDGYDFHDFDVASQDIKKVVNYYLPQLYNLKETDNDHNNS